MDRGTREPANMIEEGESMLHPGLLEHAAIFEHAPMGIMFTQPGVVKRCNPRMAQMFGYAPEELVNTSGACLFASEEHYHDFLAEAAPALHDGRLFEKAEQRLRRRDGSTFWGRVRAKSVEPGRRAAGTVWMVEDVSAARAAEIEVRAIMNNAGIGILFTRDRRVVRYNRGFAQMFGFGTEQALGMPVRSLYGSDEHYHEIGDAAADLLARGESFQAEAWMVRADGSPMWVQLIGHPVRRDDPALGNIWIIEDRTRNKRAEETLRNALLENQAILDNAVLGIAVVERGRTLHCNAKMEELFGYPPGGINGIPVAELYPDSASWMAARRETARNFLAGRVHMAEHEVVRADGTRFWARLSGRLFDLAQRQGRSVWLVDDVTARREAAQAVARARDELELRVLERTAELAGANALLQAEIVERRQAEARVHHMAYHDSLTGLPNRSLLSDRLDRAMLSSQRNDRKLAVMFIDLDRFKTINDSLGHLAGDHLLKEVANRLCRAVRASDTVARLGGDEFVVLVPGIEGPRDCTQVAEKIIEVLSAPIPHEGRILHISPSIGICLYPDHGQDVATLMRNADAAMYHAKGAGRNTWQFFTERMNESAARHFELESSLRVALAANQFELFYQPVIEAGTRRVHALEALLRWRRPGLGLVGPDEFIPILEESGMIIAVGEWVLRSACEQAVAWQRQGLPAVPVAVNLSGRQFAQRGLAGTVRRIVEETGIDPALLELEITETTLMQSGGHTLEVLEQINAMGVRLSIDDFGTGYSSLAYLKRFPVHKIKVDRAFVRELEASAEDRAIVAAVMALANSLQLSVVAEGVETEAQLQLLREHGCELAQGFLFARPLEAHQVPELLR
ncbi:EAL domain-containing protein [Massilia solisilvae]|uniref:EAL domain-containing protein n=1 Tax=Massilia solisilvae TaxID=1811225 RepID=A0ABT2BJR4_9BURK|nr:EAL domain-containing protein [Massilia solisilvae]MCS0608707.1 EAL domain-containing protein [Massilia solisilvae]